VNDDDDPFEGKFKAAFPVTAGEAALYVLKRDRAEKYQYPTRRVQL